MCEKEEEDGEGWRRTRRRRRGCSRSNESTRTRRRERSREHSDTLLQLNKQKHPETPQTGELEKCSGLHGVRFLSVSNSISQTVKHRVA